MMYGHPQGQQMMMLPPASASKRSSGSHCQATIALTFIVLISLLEVTLFSLINVAYVGTDAKAGKSLHKAFKPLRDFFVALKENTKFDFRETISGIVLPCLAVTVLILLLSCVNCCCCGCCCCGGDTCYYGFLLCTGIAIVLGTVAMTIVGIGAEFPESEKFAAQLAPMKQLRLEGSDFWLPLSEMLVKYIRTGFWIMAAVNTPFGLWVLILAIYMLFCSRDEPEAVQPFMPMQPACDPRRHTIDMPRRRRQSSHRHHR